MIFPRMSYTDYKAWSDKASGYNGDSVRSFINYIDDIVANYPHSRYSHNEYKDKLLNLYFQSNRVKDLGLKLVAEKVYKDNSNWLSRLIGSYKYYDKNGRL